jgi:hypothetical protein
MHLLVKRKIEVHRMSGSIPSREVTMLASVIDIQAAGIHP